MRERRREPRTPVEGEVKLILGEPGARQILGRLLDASRHGLRVAHDCAWLSAGQNVQFEVRRAGGRVLRAASENAAQRPGAIRARGTARVVWTRVVRAQVQSGLWIESG